MDTWIDDFHLCAGTQIPVEAFRACLVPYYVLVCNYHEAAIVTRVAEKVFQVRARTFGDICECFIFSSLPFID